MQVRTDLAEEAQDLWKQSAGKTTQLEGVKARSWEDRGVRRHQVQILDERGEKALGKPKGTYETLWVPGDGRPTPEAAEALGEAVASLLDLRGGESVLVVGLGNRDMTPDAVGPFSAGGVLVTRASAEAAASGVCGHAPGERPGTRGVGNDWSGKCGNCPQRGGSHPARPGGGGGRPGRRWCGPALPGDSSDGCRDCTRLRAWATAGPPFLPRPWGCRWWRWGRPR